MPLHDEISLISKALFLTFQHFMQHTEKIGGRRGHLEAEVFTRSLDSMDLDIVLVCTLSDSVMESVASH